ncbi:Protein FAR1-RELATED SEQUENCE 5 [Platanthera zijinensis]|uniref:Protein FAR1-RELATED SEQUENCE 5 n=1 Tax=Platanthera zijinensis TaxID=2320716 RepID=A0AAP0BPR3_9ASPA
MGMEFDTLDEIYSFYNTYALVTGFGIRKSSSSKSQVTQHLIWKKFECNKGGLKKLDSIANTNVKRHHDTRTGCMAKLEVRINAEGKWAVTQFIKEHNHILDTPRKAKKHRSHNISHKNLIIKDLIAQLHSSGMGPSSSQGALVASYLAEQQSIDHDFYYALELDIEGFLQSIFWVDSRARKNYLTFGDVIIFDVTYKTNRLLMPFAPFTGVNHHRQSILFGCALIADEKEETFVWLFQHWLHCMLDKAPQVIITDMDPAMLNAINRVFPKTRHRFCSWHINKHLFEHNHAMRDQNSEFAIDYKKWFNSKSTSSSQRRWDEFIQKYQISPNNWLSTMWNRREHWVPVFLKDIFVAGMTSSGRSESINAFFDSYVNSNTSLMDFIKQYENALNARRKAELDEDFTTMNSKPCLITQLSIEDNATTYYTRNMFKLVQIEIKKGIGCWHDKISKVENVTTYKVGEATEDKSGWCTVLHEDSNFLNINCDCSKFATDGYLCKHIFHIMIKKRVREIPTHYVLKRWTINARHVLSFGAGSREMTDQNVTPLMKWTLRELAIQVAEKSSEALDKYMDLYDELKRRQNDLSLIQSQKSVILPYSEIGSSTVVPEMPHISIRDPLKVKTKGRPKLASRIIAGIETSQAIAKQRTCGSCGEKGHYATTCPNKRNG